MRPVFLTVESNSTGVGRRILEEAARRGYDPVVLSRDPSRFPFLNDVGATVVTADTADIPSLVELCSVNDTLRRTRAVFAPIDHFGEAAAAIASSLGLPGNKPEAVALLRDKHAVRERLRSLGLDRTRSEAADSPAGAAEAAARVGFPVVLKPRRAAGSLGARHCSNRQDAFRQAEVILAIPPSLSVDTGTVIVEETIPGRQFDVHVMGGLVLAITEALFGEPPLCHSIGFDAPAVLPAETEAAVVIYVEELARSLGLGWGPLDVEVRVTHAGEVRLIEINPRLVSFLHVELVKAVTSVDLLDATIRACIGAGVTATRPAAQSRAGLLRYMFQGRSSGTYGGIQLPDPALPDLLHFHLDSATGPGNGDYRDKIGAVMAVSSEFEQARSTVRTALSRIGYPEG